MAPHLRQSRLLIAKPHLPSTKVLSTLARVICSGAQRVRSVSRTVRSARCPGAITQLDEFLEGSAARKYGNAGRIVAFKLDGGKVPVPREKDCHVLDDAPSGGMANFSNELSAADAHAIHAFLIDEAHEAGAKR